MTAKHEEAEIEALLRTMAPVRPDEDRIVVFGGRADTLDLLRLATVRSDDVVLVAPRVDAATARFAERFGVTLRLRPASEGDLAGAAAAILALGATGREDELVRAAHRQGIPVHVAGRLLASDFTLIEMLERRPSSSAATAGGRGATSLRAVA